MSAQPAPPTARMLDADGRVVVDAPCVNCGYNLRTLSADAVCPECAHPVAHSIRGDFLRYASPRWVKGLARGVLLILVAIGGVIVVRPLVAALFYVPMVIRSPTGAVMPSNAMILVMEIVQFVIDASLTGVAVVGLLSLTRRNPAFSERNEGFTARRAARLSCVLLPAPLVANLLVVVNMPPLPTITPGGPPPSSFIGPGCASFVRLAMFASVVTIIVYGLAPLGVVRHLGALMRRIPRPGLVRYARIEFWGLLASSVLLAVGCTVLFTAIIPMMTAVFASLAAPTTMPSTVTVTTTGPLGPRSIMVTNTGTPPPAPATAPATAPTTAPTTMPGGPPFPKAGPGLIAGMIVGGAAAALGSLATLGFAIAGVVLLIIACTALFAAAREAQQNAAL